MDGIIIVNKPAGWTSFDVVNKIRKTTGERKVGHSGTLDPMATGVLPIFLGRATKSIQYFLNGDKGYEGEMVLGISTDTGDADGKVINQPSPPDPLNCPRPLGEGSDDNRSISIDRVRAVFDKYKGEILQIPPMYSAVKVNGQRLYKLARKGIEVKREPRKITIFELRITNNDTGLLTDNRIAFTVLCSKGTYIRQLAMDIGADLGCGAHLSRLERTYAQPFHISQANSLDTIVTLAKIGQLSTIIISPEEILAGVRADANG